MAPQWVKEYVDKHQLQQMFEEAANAVVKARAEEPAAFLVSTRSPPPRGGERVDESESLASPFLASH